MSSTPSESDPERTEAEAAELLSRAQLLGRTVHLPGYRDEYRRLINRVIGLAEHVVNLSTRGAIDPGVETRAKLTLVYALSLATEDARYGAGQLSRGAQRAPTEEDCAEGWQRVGEIVEHASNCASRAATIAAGLAQPRASRWAKSAQRSAEQARLIVSDRNLAYTFHAQQSFSFGEGWYLAAAGVLWGVTIQIEPGQPQTEQAELFLKEAGLASQLVPYRSRPRANKALPDLVAKAYRSDAQQAQLRLRQAFLGEESIPTGVRQFVRDAVARAPEARKVLLWVRHGRHDASRNTNYSELNDLCQRFATRGIVPVLVGDALLDGPVPRGALDMTWFWKHELFQGPRMRRAQLQLFECLRHEYAVIGQVGVTTAGMDGPALMGMPTMYLTQDPNSRLGTWVGTVPGYHEIVRRSGYEGRIEGTLKLWCEKKPGSDEAGV